jgi:hypothetical protein
MPFVFSMADKVLASPNRIQCLMKHLGFTNKMREVLLLIGVVCMIRHHWGYWPSTNHNGAEEADADKEGKVGIFFPTLCV